MQDFGIGSDLAAINPSVFYEGMNIASGVYYKSHGNFVLICKDVTLTPELIEKLRHFTFLQESLYVERAGYKDVLAESLRIRQQMALAAGEGPLADSLGEPVDEKTIRQAVEMEAGFQVALSDAETLMSQVAESDLVELRLAEEISGRVSGQLFQFDGATLVQCINSVRQSDQYLYNHSVDVAILNGLIGRWLKLGQEEVDALIKTGFLHDLGKLKVPPTILNKPAALTPEEYSIMKGHPIFSYNILKNSGEKDKRVLEGVRLHHERVNGTGYPDGLTRDQIPLFARITAVSDVYSAMVSKRAYHSEQSPFDILTEFAKDRYSDLDYSIVSLFLQNMPSELIDKSVLLSNGEVAKITYVNPRKLNYPLVTTPRGLVETGPQLYCVSMSNPVSLFAEAPSRL